MTRVYLVFAVFLAVLSAVLGAPPHSGIDHETPQDLDTAEWFHKFPWWGGYGGYGGWGGWGGLGGLGGLGYGGYGGYGGPFFG